MNARRSIFPVPFTALAAGAGAAVAARLWPGYRRPIGVYFCLTPRCDNACTYCRFPTLPGDEMPLTDALEYIDAMARAGCLRLNLTGGEPLLYPGLAAVIARARGSGLFVTVSTNGHLIVEQLAALSDANLVMVSLDGPREEHDRLRGAGSYDRVCAGLEALYRAGIRFWITTVLTRVNPGAVDHLLELAAGRGCRVNFVVPNTLPDPLPGSHIPATDAVAPLLLPPDTLRQTLDRLIRLKRSGAPIGSSLPYLESVRDWPDYARLRSPRTAGYRCFAGQLYCHLYYNHRLYACGQNFGEASGMAVREAGGFAAAFAQLARVADCRSCRVACDLENNLIYNLRPAALVNWLRCL